MNIFQVKVHESMNFVHNMATLRNNNWEAVTTYWHFIDRCVSVTISLTAGRQTKKLFSVLEIFLKSDNSTPDVYLGFLNWFLAFVRLYQYVYGQFFVTVLF